MNMIDKLRSLGVNPKNVFGIRVYLAAVNPAHPAPFNL
jgi:hypothetical protein